MGRCVTYGLTSGGGHEAGEEARGAHAWRVEGALRDAVVLGVVVKLDDVAHGGHGGVGLEHQGAVAHFNHESAGRRGAQEPQTGDYGREAGMGAHGEQDGGGVEGKDRKADRLCVFVCVRERERDNTRGCRRATDDGRTVKERGGSRQEVERKGGNCGAAFYVYLRCISRPC